MRSSWTGGETLDRPREQAALGLAVHERRSGAFEQLIHEFQKPIFNYVQRMLQSSADAQEVVQDAFLRAHQTLTQRYDADRCEALAVRPWLFRIARNLALNKLRRRRPEQDGEALCEQPADSIGGVSIPILCELERREELHRLDHAIAGLPEESRELVLLRFIEEMSYAEIAQTVGGSEAALRGKVFRALKALRALLDPQETPDAV